MQFEDPTDALQSLREHVDLQRAFSSAQLSSTAAKVCEAMSTLSAVPCCEMCAPPQPITAALRVPLYI